MRDGRRKAGRGSRSRKLLDRYIGIPLVYLAGLFRRKRSMPVLPDAPRIAVLKTAGIGDAVLTSAAVRELRAAYPNARVTYICTRSNVGIAHMIEGVEEVYVFDLKRPIRSFRNCVRMERFDLVLDFAPWPRLNALIACALPAAYRVGFRRKGQYRHYVYDACVEHEDRYHEVENYRRIVQEIGIRTKGFLPGFSPAYSPEEGRYAVFHPYPAGSAAELRKWMPEKWTDLGERIQETCGCRILISGGAEDAEDAEHLAERMRGRGIAVRCIAGAYSLRELFAVLGGAAVVVSVNTGILHLAAATGVPVIALQGPTSVVRWGPLGERALAVTSDEDCQPCISLGFETDCRQARCMAHITVEMVMDRVKDLREYVCSGEKVLC